MTTKKHTSKLFITLISTLILFSACQSIPTETKTKEPVEPEEKEYVPYISRKLRDQGKLTATQLTRYFISQNPEYDTMQMLNFAFYYVDEAADEGINSDVAFAQMCLETGYLRFGNLVQPEFHNYCGLGAMDADHPGEIFETEKLGVRAHIQHLQAYSTHEDEQLNKELIDPRYSWVHKTKYVETIEGLAGTWATDPDYALKIERILRNMEAINQL